MNRYSAGAKFYDVLSGESLVYRSGRVAGVQMLGLMPGDTVFDLGCGTGLNFPFLVDAVGPDGQVIGLDLSADMLGMARTRIARAGWGNVRVLSGDATSFDPASVREASGRPVDAVFATYALSVISGVTGDWHPAWQRMLDVLRPGGRAGIVDMQLPTGRGRIFSPLARAVCAAGGADLAAHPWTALENLSTDALRRELASGHIRAVAGTI